MHWKSENPLGRFRLTESVEIAERVKRVFAQWNRYEDFPRFMDSVRHTKCVGEDRVLWDIDLAGHQIVWEARIVESVPDKRVRWESSGGTPNCGEVHFETLAPSRTCLTVEIEYRPEGLLEHVGARIGLVDRRVLADLERFRRLVESLPSDAESDDAS